MICRKEFDAALIVLGVASDRPTVELDGSRESSACLTQKTNGCHIQLLGWGSTYEGASQSRTAQNFQSRSVPRWKCRRLLRQWTSSSITNTMICSGKFTGDEAPCQGDKGGPLMYNGRQVGIFSWGIGCACSKIPSVYTAVSSIYAWLQREIDSIEEVSAGIIFGLCFRADK